MFPGRLQKDDVWALKVKRLPLKRSGEADERLSVKVICWDLFIDNTSIPFIPSPKTRFARSA